MDPITADQTDQRAPDEPVMTEMVARNPAQDPATSPPSTNGAGATGGDNGAGPPTPDPADRAAG
jgi:hypothetical protein